MPIFCSISRSRLIKTYLTEIYYQYSRFFIPVINSDDLNKFVISKLSLLNYLTSIFSFFRFPTELCEIWCLNSAVWSFCTHWQNFISAINIRCKDLSRCVLISFDESQINFANSCFFVKVYDLLLSCATILIQKVTFNHRVQLKRLCMKKSTRFHIDNWQKPLQTNKTTSLLNFPGSLSQQKSHSSNLLCPPCYPLMIFIAFSDFSFHCADLQTSFIWILFLAQLS